MSLTLLPTPAAAPLAPCELWRTGDGMHGSVQRQGGKVATCVTVGGTSHATTTTLMPPAAALAFGRLIVAQAEHILAEQAAGGEAA